MADSFSREGQEKYAIELLNRERAPSRRKLTMTTTTFGACAPFVTQLQETKMVRLEDLSKVSAYIKAFPQRGEAELAKFLVEQKVLTQFQADAALEGTARNLVLSQFILIDILGVGSMGTVYKARSTNRDAWFAIKVVPRRNAVGL